MRRNTFQVHLSLYTRRNGGTNIPEVTGQMVTILIKTLPEPIMEGLRVMFKLMATQDYIEKKC